MDTVKIMVMDVTGNHGEWVEVSATQPCEEVTARLVKERNLPLLDQKGTSIEYTLLHSQKECILQPHQTLEENGVVEGDLLCLQPQVTAAARVCPTCGAMLPDHVTFCAGCGTPIVSSPASFKTIQSGFNNYVYDHSDSTVTIIGVSSVIVILVANLVLGFADTSERDLRDLFTVISFLGQAGFYLTIVIFMTNVLRKMK